jgi:hypothetical protein
LFFTREKVKSKEEQSKKKQSNMQQKDHVQKKQSNISNNLRFFLSLFALGIFDY